MSISLFTVVGYVLVASFLTICWLWKRPTTQGGKLAVILLTINALGWFLVLPLDQHGDPPPFVMIGFIVWLINLPLLLAAIVSLWLSRKDAESRSFLAIASTYLGLNVVLFLLPVFGLLLAALTHQ